ncbi:MAG: putative DNA-binding domain-containing protein [Alphaproteobacteria bacterium]|nr:putative DNA-binding domain-containing protein [Alphaproteobacteria bacterium]
MPLALRDLQAEMAAYLVSGADADILGSIVGDTIPAAARLRIHRHQLYESLATALAGTFSTVQQLVGDPFFRSIARAFIAQALPAQPVLSEYGEGFPAFVDTYELARGLPYLADVARLDWALNLAFNSPIGRRLTAADLSSIPGEQLPSMKVGLAPGTRVIHSTYPLDRIWSASQPNASTAMVDLGGGDAWLLVFRRPDDAGFIVLTEAEAVFVTALAAGASLEDAALAAFAANARFDLSVTFSRLLDLRVFVALQQ